jgi:hypothetical protein
MTTVAPLTRREVEQVKTRDRDFQGHQSVLHARILAVAGAQQAVAAGEVGARYALRQSLIDLAAAAELIAAELPAPAVERIGRRAGWNVGLDTGH